MKRLLICGALLIVSVLLLSWPDETSANPGRPMEPCHFDLFYDADSVSVLEIELYRCESGDNCPNSRLWKNWVNHEDIFCLGSHCTFDTVNMGENWFKLVIHFSDRTRESDFFHARATSTPSFVVQMRASSLQVRQKGIIWGNFQFVGAIMLTLIIEMPLAVGYLWISGRSRTVTYWIGAGSFISLPILWYGLTRYSFADDPLIIWGELFVVVFETGFIYLVSKRLVPLKHALLLSLVMNIASFGAGILTNNLGF